jgi:hypothetical protein
VPRNVRAGIAVLTVGQVVLVALIGFGARLALGLHTPLEADEATQAAAALTALNGGPQFLTEPNKHYLGSLDVYVLTPFVALLGPTLVAVRVGLAFLGAIFSVLAYALGRLLLPSRGQALVLAVCVSLLPLYSTYYGAILAGYAEALPLELAAIVVAIMIGWRDRARLLRWWAILGLLIGISLWNDLLSLPIGGLVVVSLLVRAPVLGWVRTLRGALLATISGVIGFSPWLIYQLRHAFVGVTNLPLYHTSSLVRAHTLLSTQIPILLGGSGDRLPILVGPSGTCGADTVPVFISDAFFLVLACATLWLRRNSIRRLFTAFPTALAPADLVLLAAPVVFAVALFSSAELIPCDPRYLILAGPPTAVAMALIVVTRTSFRHVARIALIAWLVISGITASGLLPRQQISTPTGGTVPADFSPVLALLAQHRPRAVWTQYWIAVPIIFYSNLRLTVGVFGGPIAFPRIQAKAEAVSSPSWLFASDDPEVVQFLDLCRQRGVTFSRYRSGGMTLFTDLSSPLTPAMGQFF